MSPTETEDRSAAEPELLRVSLTSPSWLRNTALILAAAVVGSVAYGYYAMDTQPGWGPAQMIVPAVVGTAALAFLARLHFRKTGRLQVFPHAVVVRGRVLGDGSYSLSGARLSRGRNPSGEPYLLLRSPDGSLEMTREMLGGQKKLDALEQLLREQLTPSPTP